VLLQLILQMASRSSGPGRSTKNISSKRPMRRNPAGSWLTSLAVAMTKTGAVLPWSQLRKPTKSASAFRAWAFTTLAHWRLTRLLDEAVKGVAQGDRLAVGKYLAKFLSDFLSRRAGLPLGAIVTSKALRSSRSTVAWQ